MRHLPAILGFIAPAALAQDTATTVTYPSPVESRAGMVVCSSNLACDVGARILAKGGNAVDAAVATGFAMAVTYPSAGNIGGGGFMVVRTPRGVTTFDFRERAPLKSTPTMYLDSAGNIDRSRTARGYFAPGVPGTVRGLEMAHRKYGKLPWKDVVMPSVELARGFVLSHDLARGLTREVQRGMRDFPVSVATYGKPGGGEWFAGDTLRLPGLAASLTAIAEGGADAFYKGWIADSIAADLARNGGLITREDLAAYKAVERAPIKGEFKGHTIWSMAPPSSGGIAMVEMLNVLDRLNVGASERYSTRTLHLMIEATRRAFLDRARHIGDPDFVKVPVANLTSKTYAARLAREIDTTKAANSQALAADLMAVAESESEETTHISTADAGGMAVAMTYTLEGGYGSHVVVPGAGFLLNNEMGDFNKKPGHTNDRGDIGTPANIIAPGKRMLSSMTPTIVTRGNELVLVTGSPGGRTIINTVFDVVFNSLQYGMDVRQAVDARRLHHQWLPDTATFEANAVPPAVADSLRAMGHAVSVRGGQGDAHTIAFDARRRVFLGANDFRSRDSRVSVP